MVSWTCKATQINRHTVGMFERCGQVVIKGTMKWGSISGYYRMIMLLEGEPLSQQLGPVLSRFRLHDTVID